jgi:hypothetical protein
MTPSAPNPADDEHGAVGADAEAEMRANYPHFRRAVYSLLREKFSSELPPLADKELEAIAKEEGALPLEAFIDVLEHTPETP